MYWLTIEESVTDVSQPTQRMKLWGCLPTINWGLTEDGHFVKLQLTKMAKRKSAKTQNILNFRVLIEEDEDGIFVASVPSLQGCYTEGDTFEKAIENIKDVIKLHLEARQKKGQLADDTDTEFVGIKNLKIPYGLSANY